MTTKPKSSAQRKASAQRAPVDKPPPADAASAPFLPVDHAAERRIEALLDEKRGGSAPPRSCRTCGSINVSSDEVCPVDGTRFEVTK